MCWYLLNNSTYICIYFKIYWHNNEKYQFSHSKALINQWFKCWYVINQFHRITISIISICNEENKISVSWLCPFPQQEQMWINQERFAEANDLLWSNQEESVESYRGRLAQQQCNTNMPCEWGPQWENVVDSQNAWIICRIILLMPIFRARNAVKESQT